MLDRYKRELSDLRERAQRLSDTSGPKPSRILCAVPLTQQIEDLMRGLPLAQRSRAWALEDLLSRLHGRYSLRPSAGETGIALRRLGWTRIRDWSDSGEGRRVWLGPEHFESQHQ